MFEIEYTDDAIEDLAYFRKREQKIIVSGIEKQLHYQPTVETTNRFERKWQDIAEWELRLGTFRVYYNVEDVIRIISVQRIGEKPNNEVYFRGKRSGHS